MKSTQLHPRTLLRLRNALQRAGIPHGQVAAEAGVSKFMVSHVLNGRAKSANVIATIKRLLAEKAGAHAAA
jgi:hypothetical protein